MSLARLVPVSRLKYLTKIRDITIDDLTFRLHYRFTFSFLLIGSLLLTGEQFFGRPIQCINVKDGTVPDRVIESYCWIEGTFTLPKGLMKIIGYEVAAPGIEQYNEFVEQAKRERDEIIEHSYYQWVGIVLFLQALTFYVVHLIWKIWEKNRMANIINDLNKAIIKETAKKTSRYNLVHYLYRSMGRNRIYAFRYTFCEILNLFNIIAQMVIRLILIDFYAFVLIASLIHFSYSSIDNNDSSQRTDPMSKIFPKMTKCTFRRFGPSGDVVKTDHLCLLPLNILNEKMFVVFWFWLYIVLLFSIGSLIYRVVVMLFPYARYFLLTKLHRLAEPKDVRTVLDNCSYGDWFLINLMSYNLDPMHFRDVIRDLASQFKPKISANDFTKKMDESHF
ncbi:Innexin inx2 [Sarcoptes scabiei]|uniref:Innexin n=1 Tax=Sarcoptes scabiei TaxID=52283 RepID=A0A834VI49_SARSC|nr:Innexin inx2 [Sarcoptes scabiei]